MAGKETLRDLLFETVRETGQRIKRLTDAATDEDPFWPETIATYDSIGELAKARAQMGRALREAGIIFEERQGEEIPPEQIVTVEEPVGPSAPSTDGEVSAGTEGDGPPRTFGELLRLKIEEALPVGQTQFAAEDLSRVLGNENGLRAALNTLGLPRQGLLDRTMAIKVANKVLTTPRSSFTPHDSYSRSDVLLHLVGYKNKGNKGIVDEMSAAIGWDWKANSRVDVSEALAIRGLTMLSKLIASQQRQSA